MSAELASRTPARQTQLERAIALEWLTVGWNVVEAGIALATSVAAGSAALFGFGLDSVVESASGAIVLARLRRERRGDMHDLERLERRATRGVALSMGLLALWVAIDAGLALLRREEPRVTWVGIALPLVSMIAMVWLARQKRHAARALGSASLGADAFQTSACFWLSVVTLAGTGLNAALGWWWADPVAALGIAALLVREGWETWNGEGCAGGCSCA